MAGRGLAGGRVGPERRLADPDVERAARKTARGQRQLALPRRAALALAVEGDRPELADRLLGMAGGAEDRVPDPEGERARRMVGAEKEALVMAGRLAGPVSYRVRLFHWACLSVNRSITSAGPDVRLEGRPWKRPSSSIPQSACSAAP